MIKKINETLIYRDSWLSFYKDDVAFPNGEIGTYVKLRRKSGVGVVLISPENKIVLVKLLRYPTQIVSWEIPGGGIELKQSPVDAIIAEVEEETGIQIDAKLLEPLGSFYPLNSLSDEYISLFLARINEFDLRDHVADDAEIISLEIIEVSQALQMIKDGRINDAMTALAIHLAINKLSLNSN